MKTVLSLIASIAFFLIHILFSKKDNFIKYKTKATIDKVIYTDVGNVWYYVKFKENKEEKRAQTITYSKTNRKYHEGDTAEINYYFIKNDKNNKIRAEIIDEDLIPCSSKYGKYIFLIFAIFFFITAIISVL